MKKTNSVDSQATTPPSSTTTIIDEDQDENEDNVNDHHVIIDHAHVEFDIDHVDSTGSVDSIALMIDNSKDQVLEEIKKQFKTQLLDEFKDLFTAQQVDKPLLIKILIRGMEIIESTSIKGKDQKDLVIDVLIQILETDGVDVSHKDQLIQFLKEDANAFIDVIVDASKGKININKVESVIFVAIKYLFACFKKK